MPSNNVFQYNKIRTRNEVRRKALKPEKNGIQLFLESGIHCAGIRNPAPGIRNPRLSWIPLHGAKNGFVQNSRTQQNHKMTLIRLRNLSQGTKKVKNTQTTEIICWFFLIWRTFWKSPGLRFQSPGFSGLFYQNLHPDLYLMGVGRSANIFI